MNSITIRTAQDFPSSKRKKHSSIACDSCRKLKIRCQRRKQSLDGLSSLPQVCDHCSKLSKECSWPEEDGRKRPRTSIVSGGESQPEQTSPSTFLQGFPNDLSSQSPPTSKINGVQLHHQDGVPIAGLPKHMDQGHAWSATESHADEQAPDATSAKSAPNSNGQGIPYTTLQYYRHLGATAIAPGYKKISLKVRQDDISSADDATIQQTSVLPIFDNVSGLPASALLPHLLDAFFEFYEDNFCFLNRSHLDDLVARGEASSFLICAMSALSSRFCPHEVFASHFLPLLDGRQRERWEFSLPFSEQAKRLLMPLLSIPSCDVVAGLLFLSWADFGDNDEAGMWMLTGMAIRMAQELGLHRERSSIYSSIGQSPTHDPTGDGRNLLPAGSPPTTTESQTFERSAQIILFWCLFVQDTCLSSGTGRVPSIKRSEVNIRLPSDTDIAIVRAGPGGHPSTGDHSAYAQMVRMMLEYAESIEFLNTDSRKGMQTPYSLTSRLERIKKLRSSIIRNYKLIPQDLRLGAICYQTAVKSGQAGPYLVMHLFFHLQVTFLTQESLAVSDLISMGGQDGVPYENQHHGSLDHYFAAKSERKVEDELYRDAVKSIIDLLTFAKIIDARALWSTFFLNQSFFHAACAYIRDMLQLQHKEHDRFSFGSESSAFPIPSHTSPSVLFNQEDYQDRSLLDTKPTSAEEYLALIAKTNYHFLREAVKDMARYYAGAGWVDAVLDQRETGLRDVDLSIVSESISTFVRLHDLRGGNKGRAALKETTMGLAGNQEASKKDLTVHEESPWPPDLMADAPLNFDAQAFFDEYMVAEFADQTEFPVYD